MGARAWRVVTCVVLVGMSGSAKAQESDALRLTGEVRLRGEALRAATALDHEYTALRSRLGLEATLGERGKVFLQVQDARAFGEETGTMDADADLFDLHQGWLELTQPLGELALVVRAGRQELLLGNERLVGPVGWSNTGRSFDALRLSLGPQTPGWQLTGFAATVAERGPRTENAADEVAQADHTFLGAYADAQLLDAWFLFDRGAAYRVYRGVDRATVGARVDLPALGGLTAWAEGSYQFGNQLSGTTEQQDISAYLLGGRATYALPAAPLRSVGVGVDYLSGDEIPGAGDYQAFNVLYHTGHKWYGYLDLFLDPAARTGDRGLVDGMASATLWLADNVPLSIDVHRFWTAQQRSLTIGGEPAGADEASDLGWEFDFTVPVTLGSNQRLQLGYSAFRNGAAAPLVGLGPSDDWWHWGYVMLTFGFSGGVN